MTGRSVGKNLKNAGYTPGTPIFMFPGMTSYFGIAKQPGFCSSVLRVKKSVQESKWDNTLLWCNSYHLAKCKATRGIVSSNIPFYLSDCQDSWLKHMMLDKTLYESNKGVEIEVVEVVILSAIIKLVGISRMQLFRYGRLNQDPCPWEPRETGNLCIGPADRESRRDWLQRRIRPVRLSSTY